MLYTETLLWYLFLKKKVFKSVCFFLKGLLKMLSGFYYSEKAKTKSHYLQKDNV